MTICQSETLKSDYFLLEKEKVLPLYSTVMRKIIFDVVWIASSVNFLLFAL